MGFSSLDDWLNKVSVGGKYWRTDWSKINGTTVGVLGQWRDHTILNGSPVANIWGERLINSAFIGSANGWTLGTGWAYGTNNVIHSVGSLSSISQTPNLALVPGRTYQVVFTSSGVSGSGSFRVKVGGTAGTDRSTNSTFTESIVAGAGALIEIESDAARGVTITNVFVKTPLEFTPYNSGSIGAPYIGSDPGVGETKHILSLCAYTAVATACPAMLMFLDVLGVYPGIDMNNATVQSLINNDTLPRHIDGIGVGAFLSISTAAGAVGHSIEDMVYTAPGSVGGRDIPVAVACTASSPIGHLTHSGVAANNYGPFIPLQMGDTGIMSIQSFKLTAASGGGIANLVLARPITHLPLPVAGVAVERDCLNQLPSLPRIESGAYIGWIHYCTGLMAAAATTTGSIDFCWG